MEVEGCWKVLFELLGSHNIFKSQMVVLYVRSYGVTIIVLVHIVLLQVTILSPSFAIAIIFSQREHDWAT